MKLTNCQNLADEFCFWKKDAAGGRKTDSLDRLGKALDRPGHFKKAHLFPILWTPMHLQNEKCIFDKSVINCFKDEPLVVDVAHFVGRGGFDNSLTE